MKDETAALISVNHAVRDSEIEEIEAMLAAADPGEWRVTNGALARYAGPLERPAESLAFAAKARAIVPRLGKGRDDAALVFVFWRVRSYGSERGRNRWGARVAYSSACCCGRILDLRVRHCGAEGIMIRTGFVSGCEPVFSYNIVGTGESRLDSALRARAWCAQHANSTAADRAEIEAEIARCRDSISRGVS